MAFADFLVDDEDDRATHLEAAQFVALFKMEVAGRLPVQAFLAAVQLPGIHKQVVGIHDTDASHIRRAHLHHENFGAVIKADAASEAFVDTEQTFHAFDAARIHRPKRSGAVAGVDQVTLDRAMDAVVVERCQINRCKGALFKTRRHLVVAEQILEFVELSLRLDKRLLSVIKPLIENFVTDDDIHKE